MTTAVLTPEYRSRITEFGNQYRKQLLPIGEVNYKGRRLQFTRDYLQGLIRSFKEQAFDAVPFQLAGDKNEHSNDPERRRGTVVGVELTSNGLDAIVELDEDGEKLIKKYPDIGVSARIYENYDRSDGKHWEAALQHVLATVDPHITGMKSWQKVLLSQQAEDITVIDLSNSTFVPAEERKEENEKGKEEPVPTKLEQLKGVLAKIKAESDVELSDDELDLLLAITESTKAKEDEASDEDESVDEVDLTDEELDALIAEAAEDEATDTADEDSSSDTETEEVPVATKERKLVAASNEGDRSALEFANAQIEMQGAQLADIRARFARDAFEAEKRQFAQVYGIPPFITELARDLLEGEVRAVELSNGSEVDAGQIVRSIFTTLGKQIKILDLGGVIGNGLPEPDEEVNERQRAKTETEDFVKEIKSRYHF